MSFPLSYHQPVFRPPSEANSLILQVTHGCSWNQCAFCEMYTSKRFEAKKEEEVFAEIDALQLYAQHIRKVFLADGNAMVLSFQRLDRILDKLAHTFPKLQRVSAYALPSDLRNKTDEELTQLVSKGLKILYVGIESGDNELLKRVNKNESHESMVHELLRAKAAGFKLSVMILNGLGGELYSRPHAANSALIVNAIQPEYLSTLVLSFPYGTDHFRKKFKGEFAELSVKGLIQEMGWFIKDLELEQSIFRSDHASNYLVLKGNLNRDKQMLLDRIGLALNNPALANLKPDHLRSL